MKMNYGVLFNRKTGKIFKVMSGYMSSMMRMWALNGNVSSTRDFVIFDEDGVINFYCEGRKDDMPEVQKDVNGRNIEEFCKGLLEAVKE